jgi:hypothetical protein
LLTTIPVSDSEPEDDPCGLNRCQRKSAAALERWRKARIDPSTLRPDSKEVRSLALYAEAAEQLIQSSFFGEDDPCTLHAVGEPPNFKVTGAKFGPVAELKSILGPFRRICVKSIGVRPRA